MNQYRVKLTCRKPDEEHNTFLTIDTGLTGNPSCGMLKQLAEVEAIQEAKSRGCVDISVVNVTYC